tara:strand:+ start:1746 stop:2258 length:513 start_codon:yes stop_codon:yes gene_type:complete
MPPFQIDIDIQDQKWLSVIPDIEGITHNIITTILVQFFPKAQYLEVSIVLSDDDFIQRLNKQYRDKDKATNVLSFPQTEIDDINADTPFLMLGDIIISSDTIASEATEQNKDIKSHFTHMLVHGCLHLLHYDHIIESEAEEMEQLEIKILKTLGIKNPYEIQLTYDIIEQ